MIQPQGRIRWTHPSVRQLAGDRDPLDVIVTRARDVALQAQEDGWSGPPYDPVELARLLNIDVQPREDVRDARTVPIGRNRVRIEFNPDRPGGRTRYSLAHEVAHTFFPDVAERVRNRAHRGEMSGDEWQLEMLCNVAAAELLMPIGSFPELHDEQLSIERLLDRRRQFQVSTEAVLIRAIRLTDQPVAMFAAAPIDRVTTSMPRYRIDYTLASRTFAGRVPVGTRLPVNTSVAECTAIGFTARGKEQWPRMRSAVTIECVGIPPYPDHVLPRVVGLVRTDDEPTSVTPRIEYVLGDATQPRGAGPHVVAHVVNDRTPNWGGPFARAVRDRWPRAQQDFREWVEDDRSRLSLGATRVCDVTDDTCVFTMISQKGYGPSRGPRIRYVALETCLRSLSGEARRRNASVHMPAIGCGEAGGRWEVVQELIDNALCRNGLRVLVYRLPGRPDPTRSAEPTLFS